MNWHHIRIIVYSFFQSALICKYFIFSFITCKCSIFVIISDFSGDNEAGKTTLIAKLEANEDPRKGSGLEYHVIDVQDKYGDGKNALFHYL